MPSVADLLTQARYTPGCVTGDSVTCSWRDYSNSPDMIDPPSADPCANVERRTRLDEMVAKPFGVNE